MMHRVREQADGTRRVEKFTGPSDAPKHLADDKFWTPVLDLKPDEVYSGFVRAAADCGVAPHPRADADGVLIDIAGVKFGVPTEQAEALANGILDAVKTKRGG